MLIRILPEELRKDGLKKPELFHGTTRGSVEWAKLQIMWSKNELLASNFFKEEDIYALRPRDRPRKQPQPTTEVPPVAAIEPPPRPVGKRPPVPKEWGNNCYHCGKPRHSRTVKPGSKFEPCRKFTALLKQYDGELPPNYKGALEEYMEPKGLLAQRSSVNQLIEKEHEDDVESEIDSDSDAESTTGNMIWEAPPQHRVFKPQTVAEDRSPTLSARPRGTH